jgi:hypothetical protein
MGWFRRSTPPPDPLVLHLLEVMQRQQEAQTRLLERVLEQSAQHVASSQAMVHELTSLWKPTREPLSSSMSERELKKEADNLWDPIAENVFAQLDADLGIPTEFLS